MLILRCCHRHDCCYGDAERFGCYTKTDQYQWKCEEKAVECGRGIFDIFNLNPYGKPLPLSTLPFPSFCHIQTSVSSLCESTFSGGRLSDFFLEYDPWQTPPPPAPPPPPLRADEGRSGAAWRGGCCVLLHRLLGGGPPSSSHPSCLGTHGVLLQSGAAPLKCN